MYDLTLENIRSVVINSIEECFPNCYFTCEMKLNLLELKNKDFRYLIWTEPTYYNFKVNIRLLGPDSQYLCFTLSDAVSKLLENIGIWKANLYMKEEFEKVA